jgi:hypothetical protein
VSASISNTFNVFDMGSVVPPAVSVDGPAYLGAFLLVPVFLSMRKRKDVESSLVA